MSRLRRSKRTVSTELWQAIADAQASAQHAHNLAYKEPTSYWLKTALGKAQNILIHWQVKLAGRQRA